MPKSAEQQRLEEDAKRETNWKRWGPYLADRQWATVREDYSADGSCWEYFPHDHARSRAYRWGEDGLLGISDRQGRLCFAIALWNERDPILKERLFGVTGPQGNHGEDVKECYFHLDSTPTHSYMKALYKYPQARFPYEKLIEENQHRGRDQQEYELADTGVFEGDRYFDVFIEYAKGGPNDILVRITIENRGDREQPIHVLPTLWFRNTWSWGREGEENYDKPAIWRASANALTCEQEGLGRYRFEVDPETFGPEPKFLFTDNESNAERLWNSKNASRYVKDAFHRHVIDREADAVSPAELGTKIAAHHRVVVPSMGKVVLHCRLSAEDEAPKEPFGARFDRTFRDRITEADEFYAHRLRGESEDARAISRQAYAGLLWSKQFYYYVVDEWLHGDPANPPPPDQRTQGRNAEWTYVHCRDVISMPDKWEYPWFAAWDLAFHTIPFAKVDPEFAKHQLVLLLREWYMHPNGQLPAYEFAFSDVNPPVHAWAAWRVYKISEKRGHRDRAFLARVFQKLLLNFTWWVNRKDDDGNNLFSGGFLGLDNIGVFDRSKPLPIKGHLAQADGTAWMAFYCATMLSIALELAEEDEAYEDMASKFFEHFVAITDAMNTLGGTGLWDERDGFYYDQLVPQSGKPLTLRVRSMVGIIPLFAVSVLEDGILDKLKGFGQRARWFLRNRTDLARHITYLEKSSRAHQHRLLAIPSRERLQRVLHYVLDEREFLSPYGIRSLSKIHQDEPYRLQVNGESFEVSYVPGESRTGLFGGNSNWRGPIWFPVNYLLVEALERYYHFYGDGLTVECPTGSGHRMHLGEVAREINKRLTRLFVPDARGNRPCHGGDRRFAEDPAWRNLLQFHEYFDGDTGRGCGASHQTGWTALVVRMLEDLAER